MQITTTPIQTVVVTELARLPSGNILKTILSIAVNELKVV